MALTQVTMRALSMSRSTQNATPTLSIIDHPLPKVTPGNVLVQIRASSINPSDILNSKGGFSDTTFPRVPGRDFAGIIIDGPAHLHGLEIFGTSGASLGFTQDGPHAEFCLIAEDAFVEKPKTLSFSQAATIGVPFSSAALCLERGRVRANDTVLVIGSSGSVGSAAVQLARSKGCNVVTAARGHDADIDLSKDKEMNEMKEWMDEGKGVDVVIDTTGDPNLLRAGLALLSHAGRLVFIAAPRSGSTAFTFDLESLYRSEKEILGCNSLSHSAADSAASLQRLLSSLEHGELNTLEENGIVKITLDDAVDVYKGSKLSGKKAVIVF